MATKNLNWSGDGKTASARIVSTSSNATNNRSSMSLTLTFSGVSYANTQYVNVVVGDHSEAVQIPANTASYTVTKTWNQSHDANGKKSVSISITGTFGPLASMSMTGTMTLDEIDRHSNYTGFPLTGTYTLGQSYTLGLTHKATNVYVKCSYKISGMANEVTFYTGNGSSCVLNIPTSYGKYIKSSSLTETVTLYCRTYNNAACTVFIDGFYCGPTAKVPDYTMAAPTIQLSHADDLTSGDTWVKGVSIPKLTIGNCDANYGLTPTVNWSITKGGGSGSRSGNGEVTGQSPNDTGTATITVTATDERGKTATSTATFTVTAYTITPTVQLSHADDQTSGNTWIKGVSIPKLTIGGCGANYGVTPTVSWSITRGGGSGSRIGNGDVVGVAFSDVGASTITVTATDSRGYTATVTLSGPTVSLYTIGISIGSTVAHADTKTSGTTWVAEISQPLFTVNGCGANYGEFPTLTWSITNAGGGTVVSDASSKQITGAIFSAPTGTFTITVTAIDSRGATGTATKTVMNPVIAYTKPTISSVSNIRRTDENGADSIVGTYFRIRLQGSAGTSGHAVWKVEKNSYETVFDSGSLASIDTDYPAAGHYTDLEIGFSESATFVISVTDAWGYVVSVTIRITTALIYIMCGAGTEFTGMSFGKPNTSGNLQIGLPVELNGQFFWGEELQNYTDLNDIVTAGRYFSSVASNSFTHSPMNGKFQLLVIPTTSNKKTTGAYVSEFKQYIAASDTKDIYVRSFASSAAGAVTFGDWEKIGGSDEPIPTKVSDLVNDLGFITGISVDLLWSGTYSTSTTPITFSTFSEYKAFIIVGHPYNTTGARASVVVPSGAFSNGSTTSVNYAFSISDEDANYSFFAYYDSNGGHLKYRGRSGSGVLSQVWGVK